MDFKKLFIQWSWHLTLHSVTLPKKTEENGHIDSLVINAQYLFSFQQMIGLRKTVFRAVQYEIYESIKNVTTSLSLKDYHKHNKLLPDDTIDTVNYQLSVLNNSGIQELVEWMLHSVFCLQPPGDTLTRKGFYDSILCSCIPLISRWQ